MAERDPRLAIEAVFRIESAKLIAGLTRFTRDVGRAEELAQDALVAALEQWPAQGVPDNPGAWLMQAAKHRAVDGLRRAALLVKKNDEVAREAQEAQGRTPDLDTALDEDVGDDLLRLVLISCHPVLSTEGRVALTLRLLGGLTTEEIARAFLVPEPTIAQRIVRAKRTLAEAKVPFEVPHGEALEERLASVLEVIYLVFNEGYSATAGDDWLRPGLCEDALRLGRILSELTPAQSEVHGLVALMELQASRMAARVARDGTPILLADQNRSRWDGLLIQRGLAAMQKGAALAEGNPGPYLLQAGIAACHARAKTFAETDWATIVGLYGALSQLNPSPVIELNRAVALSMLMGPEAGLRVLDGLRDEPVLKTYYLLPGARADLLIKLRRFDEARAELERAIALTHNERERALMRARADALPRD